MLRFLHSEGIHSWDISTNGTLKIKGRSYLAVLAEGLVMFLLSVDTKNSQFFIDTAVSTSISRVVTGERRGRMFPFGNQSFVKKISGITSVWGLKTERFLTYWLLQTLAIER